MTREEQRAKAAHEYIQSDSVAAGNEVLAFGDFINGAKWADFHPHWIPVEEELPKEKGKYMFRLSNGDMCYETYYPKLKLVANVTHWMPIVPPRKEE
jgi:hypothetical protein